MPWREVSIVDQRREFVRLAMQERSKRGGMCVGDPTSQS